MQGPLREGHGCSPVIFWGLGGMAPQGTGTISPPWWQGTRVGGSGHPRSLTAQQAFKKRPSKQKSGDRTGPRGAGREGGREGRNRQVCHQPVDHGFDEDL